MGTYARSEIRQDKDNADQKVKWFLKVYKTLQTFVGSILLIIFPPKFLYWFTFYQLFDFHPALKMKVKHRN